MTPSWLTSTANRIWLDKDILGTESEELPEEYQTALSEDCDFHKVKHEMINLLLTDCFTNPDVLPNTHLFQLISSLIEMNFRFLHDGGLFKGFELRTIFSLLPIASTESTTNLPEKEACKAAESAFLALFTDDLPISPVLVHTANISLINRKERYRNYADKLIELLTTCKKEKKDETKS